MFTHLPSTRSGQESLTIPDDALRLFIDLDVRGLKWVADKDGRLIVSAKEQGLGQKPELTEQERSLIRTYKRHLLALVAYCA